MTCRPPNFIWRKHAAQHWLEAHETALTEATSGAHSIIERPGRPRLTVELFCRDRRAAERVVAEFGGSIHQLPDDWQARFFAGHRTKPLRIGRRLLVVDEECELSANARHAMLVIPAGAA